MDYAINFSRVQAAVSYKTKTKKQNQGAHGLAVSATNAPYYHKQGLLELHQHFNKTVSFTLSFESKLKLFWLQKGLFSVINTLRCAYCVDHAHDGIASKDCG